MAILLQYLGNKQEAAALLLKIYIRRINTSGEYHQETLRVGNNLAVLYNELGILNKSREIFLRLMRISIKLRGEDHIETLDLFYNYAILLQSEKRHEEAKGFILFKFKKKKEYTNILCIIS